MHLRVNNSCRETKNYHEKVYIGKLLNPGRLLHFSIK